MMAIDMAHMLKRFSDDTMPTVLVRWKLDEDDKCRMILDVADRIRQQNLFTIDAGYQLGRSGGRRYLTISSPCKTEGEANAKLRQFQLLFRDTFRMELWP